eukprot:8452712-Alexandrium_andersonii.AAC.1
MEHNVELLANAYFHLFVEVAGLCAGGDLGPNIRVPPASSGVFAGQLKGSIAMMGILAMSFAWPVSYTHLRAHETSAHL